MAEDIVARLRAEADESEALWSREDGKAPAMREAADEIERLRKMLQDVLPIDRAYIKGEISPEQAGRAYDAVRRGTE